MGSRFLTDLADVCRRGGLTVIEVGSSPSATGTAWKSRARGSGGYDSGLPDHIMIHHTASGSKANGWSDVNYCTFNSSVKPICNLYLDRGGKVYVCAAGATNTNGTGIDPCNGKRDAMNRHAISIEGGNDGRGELWPTAQENAYIKLVNALCGAYGIPTSRVHSHREYAPGRKVDPAGPDRWASGAQTWNMNTFRSQLAPSTGSGGGTTPPPVNKPDPPPEPPTDLEAEEMYAVYKNPNGGYCLGRIGDWHAHSGTAALNTLAFEAGNGWAVDVKSGKRVNSWSQVGTLDSATAAKHFERYLGNDYGKV